MTDWAPKAGETVRIKDNPGKSGPATGKFKTLHGKLHAEVQWGPSDHSYKPIELLEPFSLRIDPLDELAAERTGDHRDLRRLLTFEKVRGSLTNVFYSMESGNTQFLPHQFKPVLRFIESATRRLLIADEVGLGKTIETIYIWKELQAREAARRMLVVCPAVLRKKWVDELSRKFNIDASIADAEGVFQALEKASHNRDFAFVLVASLEGIRPPKDFDDPRRTSARARLARLLEDRTTEDESSLLDLVVFDEAHYLRNRETAGNLLATLLNDSAGSTVFLSATPIQTRQENLFSLLHLIDPDQFFQSETFAAQMAANAPITKALRMLWNAKGDTSLAAAAIGEALSTPYFRDDPVLVSAVRRLTSQHPLQAEERVYWGRQLEARSLLNQYVTRSRKREVEEKRVERGAQTLRVEFTPTERKIYDEVSRKLRQRAKNTSLMNRFALLGRQRQMASSMVAAIRGWYDNEAMQEVLWEDTGIVQPELFDDQTAQPVEIPLGETDLAALADADSKYNKLRAFLRDELAQRPGGKIIVFSYFRGTLAYLKERLKTDGITTCIIVGGMGDEKNSVLDTFASPDGPSVLLSSEVGSEGIDLQFSRVVVNYDLPWNPMKVEQRIGRIDRFGQKADRITIVNLVVGDTVEDRILNRLYERIRVFEESIGDLEQILGETNDALRELLLSPDLTDEERERKADEVAIAIENKRVEQNRLEEEAINLVGFSEFLLSSIRESRDGYRWLSPNEIYLFVDDFFKANFPGTVLKQVDPKSMQVDIRLSDNARHALADFIQSRKPARRTRLHQSLNPIRCSFDPRRSGELKANIELVDPAHPLILWCKHLQEVADKALHPVSVSQVTSSDIGLEKGIYAFAVQNWLVDGFRKENILSFQAIHLQSSRRLGPAESERLVLATLVNGQNFPAPFQNGLESEPIVDACRESSNFLDDRFGTFLADFIAINESRCNQLEAGARNYASRRIERFEVTRNKHVESGNKAQVTIASGRIQKEQDELARKLQKIEANRKVDYEAKDIAIGAILVV